MKKRETITVQARSEKGTGAGRRLRAQAQIPGIYYDDKGQNIMISVADLPFRKLLQKVGKAKVFDLVIEKDGQTQTHPSLVWAIQPHPFRNQFSHVDFYGVDPNKEIHVNVGLQFTGKAKGITVGGKLEIYRETVEVVCLPENIPDQLVIDVTELGLNQHISVKEITLPQGVRAVFDSNFAVVGVVTPVAETEEDEAAAAAPAPAAAPAAK